MLITKLLNKYIGLGHSYRNAQNLASEEIILTKIASSSLAESITLKGGIVMFNLTKSDRRVTQDIDFDLIRYSIDEESIKRFISKLNSTDDDISVNIIGKIDKLHQEDYQGVRVHLLLNDRENTRLRSKLDIGVHTYSAIDQDKVLFTFESGNKAVEIKVNPPEQIFIEKLLSLAMLGSLSTRYKDIYDLYYLMSNNLIEYFKVKRYLDIYLASSNREPHKMYDIINAINDTLNNKDFADEATKPASKWIDVDYQIIKETIINYISNL